MSQHAWSASHCSVTHLLGLKIIRDMSQHAWVAGHCFVIRFLGPYKIFQYVDLPHNIPRHIFEKVTHFIETYVNLGEPPVKFFDIGCCSSFIVVLYSLMSLHFPATSPCHRHSAPASQACEGLHQL